MAIYSTCILVVVFLFFLELVLYTASSGRSVIQTACVHSIRLVQFNIFNYINSYIVHSTQHRLNCFNIFRTTYVKRHKMQDNFVNC